MPLERGAIFAEGDAMNDMARYYSAMQNAHLASLQGRNGLNPAGYLRVANYFPAPTKPTADDSENFKLRADKKLIGTDKIVPNVVAIKARKTVSIILPNVS
jgi:hypothetical protein